MMQILKMGFSLCCILMIGGCASQELDFTQKLIIGMYGVFEAPTDVTGNSEPKFHKYTLQNITITQKDDGTEVDVFDESDVELRIINRSQIIHEVDMTDYDGTTFSAITVTFDTAVEASGPLDTELSFDMANSVIQHVEDFTVATAKEERMNIEVQWKNTINLDEDAETESIEASTYTTAFDDS